MENNDLISLGSPSEAVQHIKRLLGGNHLKENEKLEESLGVLDVGLRATSPADVDNIFALDLNFLDINQINKQETSVKQFFEDHSEKVFPGFVWVEISDDGTVVVVGKSKCFQRSELFNKYPLPPGDTAKALIKQVCSPDDQAMLQQWEDQINKKIVGAVIIPISYQVIKDNANYLSQVETLIGEQIVRAYGAVNPTSHTKN